MYAYCIKAVGSVQFTLFHVVHCSFITLLIRLLLDAPSTVDSQQLFSQFASRVVSDIVLPNSIWRGGR